MENTDFFNKAKEKEELGMYEEALEYYNKAIEENPDNIEAYFGLNLVKSYISIKNMENTEEKNYNALKYNKHIELLNVFNEFLDEK